MVGALVRLAIVLGIFWLAGVLLRALRAGRPPRVGPGGVRRPVPPPRPERPPHLKVVELKKSPWEVLGLEPGAGPEEVRAARDRLLAANDPARVAHMSPEVQAAARRVCEEVREASAELLGEERA